MYFKVPPFVAGTTPPLLTWAVVQFLLVGAIVATDISITFRALDPDILDIPGSSDKLTARIFMVLLVMGLFCLVGSRITNWPVAVYLGGVAAVVVVTGAAYWWDWDGRTLLLSQTGILFAAVALATCVTGVARRRIGRAEFASDAIA